VTTFALVPVAGLVSPLQVSCTLTHAHTHTNITHILGALFHTGVGSRYGAAPVALNNAQDGGIWTGVAAGGGGSAVSKWRRGPGPHGKHFFFVTF